MATEKHKRLRLGECIVQAVLLAFVLAVFFPGITLRGEIALPGILLQDIAPWRSHLTDEYEPDKNYSIMESFTAFQKYYAVAQDCLENGEWPLWNRYENTGMPLLANYQSTVFYPPRLLFALLDRLTATTVFVLLKMWFCGFCAYLCGRWLDLRPATSRFFSVAWMLGGYAVVWTYFSPTDTAAWIPVVFTGAELVVMRRFRKGLAVLLVGDVMLLLSGHPESALIAGVCIGIYFALRVLTTLDAGLVKRSMAAGLVWVPALLICAAQILPFGEYLAHSATFYERSGIELDIFKYSYAEIPALFIPRFFGTDLDGNYWGTHTLNQTYLGMLYTGLTVWLAAFLAAGLPKQAQLARKRAFALAIPALLALAMAFRPPAMDFIHNLPVLSSMRPAYYAVFGVFALPLLAALAIDVWYFHKPRLRGFLVSAGAALVIGVIVMYFVLFNKQVLAMQGILPFVQKQVVIAGSVVAITLILIGLRFAVRAPGLLIHALGIVLVVDLMAATWGFNHTSPREKIFPPTDLIRLLAETCEEPMRISDVTASITAGLLPICGFETWMGFDAMLPHRIVTLRKYVGQEPRGAIEPACTITHYLYVAGTTPVYPNNDPACLNKVATLDGIDVYENLCALPRAYLAARTLDVPDKEARFSVLSSSGFNPRYTAVVQEPLPGPAPSAELSDLGPAEVLERTATHVRIQASSEADCVLVLADAYYPGWKATVDGEPVEVFPVNHAFRGILMPEGKHMVKFRYAPVSFVVGLTISSCALLVFSGVALCILWRISQRKRRHG